MQHPLASLWRHPARVLFYQSSGRAEHGQPHAMGTPRRFASTGDAFDYLRYWLGEPGARSELKSILQRSGPSLAGAHSGVDGWQHALARRMATGAVLVVEERTQLGAPGRLIGPSAASTADAAVAALPLLSDVSPATPVPVQLPVQEPAASAVTTEASNAAPVTESEGSESAADQIAQAEVLEAAAKDGTPFCEICEAARKAAEQTSESATNQIAQAETFEQAARDGTPFCEICEKMRKDRESPNE